MAGAHRLNLTKRRVHGYPLLTGSAAGRTVLRLGSRLCPGSLADITDRITLELEFLPASKRRFLKGQLQIVLQVGTALRGILTPAAVSAEAAKAAAKQVSQNVVKTAKAAETAAVTLTTTHGILEAELIISGPLLRIRQHLIRLIDLFKACLSLFVIRMQIRVTGLCRLSVSFL